MNTKETNLNEEKITFVRYYEQMPARGKNSKEELRQALRPYITESHFYRCMRENKFKPIMQKEIERILNKKFEWTNDEI